MTASPILEVENFAQIRKARIEFGDLTVLVGEQATGKSLLLQWLKLAVDAGEVLRALWEAGHEVATVSDVIDAVFGEGMANAWRPKESEVRFNGKTVSPWMRWPKKKPEGGVFYIPAHRALLLAEGWPAPFQKLNADTPVVARLFSQNLYQRFSGRGEAALFPVERNLKIEYREAIDKAVFHGGRVELRKAGLAYRLRLAFGKTKLPYMTWTAGQREFTPLLLGLYHVLLPRKGRKRDGVEWVVIEEPEMGLHPAAIRVVMLLVLDLLWRGYRVVVSTHSPLVLDAMWALQRLKEHGAQYQVLCDAFGVSHSQQMKKVMETALAKEYRTYFLESGSRNRGVVVRDISRLDPDSRARGEADWGGLTGFSSGFGAAVRRAVNEAEG